MDNALVLVISDDCNLRQTAAAFVQRRGYRVTSAHSVVEARRMLKWGLEPCLILADPTTAGVEAVRGELGDGHPVMSLPIRTSASGVRRIAKGDGLEGLLHAHCGETSIAA